MSIATPSVTTIAAPAASPERLELLHAFSSHAASSARPDPAYRVSWWRFARLAFGTVLAAVIANSVLYFLAGTLVAYDPDFVVLADVVGTIIFTLTGAIGAVLVYAGLLRWTRRPARIFSIVSAIVFVVTLIPDFTYIPSVPGDTDAQTAVLVAMHAVAATVIVGLLTRSVSVRTR